MRDAIRRNAWMALVAGSVAFAVISFVIGVNK